MKLFPKPDPIPFALILLTFLITVLTSAEVDTWVFTVPVCLIGFIFYIAHLRAKKRTEAMRALAESLEMEFEAEKFHPSKLGIDGIDLFEKGRSQKVINLIKGTFEDTNTFIFDYHYVTGGGKTVRNICKPLSLSKYAVNMALNYHSSPVSQSVFIIDLLMCSASRTSTLRNIQYSPKLTA
jgi:hypothetical protein